MIALVRRGPVLAATSAILLANTPSFADWSMFHGDPRHSGAANIASLGVAAWSFPTSDTVEFTSAAVGPDGTIYVANLAGDLYALRNAGNLRWKLSGLSAIRYSTPAVAPDGTIYVGGTDGSLYAVNPTGTLRWTYHAGGAVRTSPNIGADGTVYFGADDGKLYAVTPAGNPKWVYATGDTIRSSPAIGPDGTIFFGSEDSYFYALNAAGTLRWRAATGAQIKYCSPAVSAGGIVYFGSYDGFVYAMTSAGTLQWAHYAAHVLRSSPAIGADGTIFMGVDSDLVALDPIDGSQRFKHSTGAVIYSSPAFTALDTTVVVGSDDGIVYGIHANPSAANYGHTSWAHTLGPAVRSSPAADLAGDVIVADLAGKVWALGPLITAGAPAPPPLDPPLRAEPNPSTGEVWFQALRGASSPPALGIFDVHGRRVAVVSRSGDGYRWNGHEPGAARVNPGVYLYRLEGQTTGGRLVMLR